MNSFEDRYIRLILILIAVFVYLFLVILTTLATYSISPIGSYMPKILLSVGLAFLIPYIKWVSNQLEL